MPCFRRLSFALHLRETQMSVWVYKRTHAEREGKGRGGRGLQFLMAVSCCRCCCCRKFPLVSSAPRPHILPPLFQCFRSKLPVTARNRAGRAERRRSKLPFFSFPPDQRPSPSAADRWYGLPRAARSLTVAGSEKRGLVGRSPGSSTVRSSLSLSR